MLSQQVLLTLAAAVSVIAQGAEVVERDGYSTSCTDSSTAAYYSTSSVHYDPPVYPTTYATQNKVHSSTYEVPKVYSSSDAKVHYSTLAAYTTPALKPYTTAAAYYSSSAKKEYHTTECDEEYEHTTAPYYPVHTPDVYHPKVYTSIPVYPVVYNKTATYTKSYEYTHAPPPYVKTDKKTYDIPNTYVKTDKKTYSAPYTYVKTDVKTYDLPKTYVKTDKKTYSAPPPYVTAPPVYKVTDYKPYTTVIKTVVVTDCPYSKIYTHGATTYTICQETETEYAAPPPATYVQTYSKVKVYTTYATSESSTYPVTLTKTLTWTKTGYATSTPVYTKPVDTPYKPVDTPYKPVDTPYKPVSPPVYTAPAYPAGNATVPAVSYASKTWASKTGAGYPTKTPQAYTGGAGAQAAPVAFVAGLFALAAFA